jgi:uncharacterized protein
MQPSPAEGTPERAVGPDQLGLDARFPGKYLSVTSFKRDGSGVATPVWFVIENGRLLIHTDPQSFKAKRIRQNPAVMIAPCSGSGRLRGEPVPAKAEFLPQSEMDHVGHLLERKYRIDRILILPLYRAVQRLRGAPAGTTNVAIAITPTAAASNQRFSEDPS